MQTRRSIAIAGMAVAATFATTLGLGTSFGLFAAAQPGSPAGHLGGRNTTPTNDQPANLRSVRLVAADD